MNPTIQIRYEVHILVGRGPEKEVDVYSYSDPKEAVERGRKNFNGRGWHVVKVTRIEFFEEVVRF